MIRSEVGKGGNTTKVSSTILRPSAPVFVPSVASGAAITTTIITNNGSVQHLDFLDEWTKDVFKTAVEIDQKWIIDMASDRQMDICQSQSLNIFFPANVSKQELHAIHMMAWKRKVKTLYYLRSEAIKRAETVSDEALRQYIFDSIDDEGCLACEG